MPRTAPEAKKKAIMELGAEVVLCEAPERFEVGGADLYGEGQHHDPAL